MMIINPRRFKDAMFEIFRFMLLVTTKPVCGAGTTRRND